MGSAAALWLDLQHGLWRGRRDQERAEPRGKSREDRRGLSEEHSEGREAGRAECDYVFGEPRRNVRRGRREELYCRVEPRKENRGRQRRDHLPGAFEQQGG